MEITTKHPTTQTHHNTTKDTHHKPQRRKRTIDNTLIKVGSVPAPDPDSDLKDR